METRQFVKPRILHPGVTSSGGATIIDSGPGERVNAADWRMPASFKAP